jgi:hypothetical protein
MTLASLFWFIVPPLFFVAAAVAYGGGPQNLDNMLSSETDCKRRI